MNESPDGHYTDDSCSICLIEEIVDKVTNSCGHSFCKDCLDEWLSMDKFTCPICIQPISYIDHNDERIRLIRHQVMGDSNEGLQINEDNITINKKTCNIFRGLSLIIIGVFFFQTYMIYKMYNKNDKLRELYSTELNKYNTIINILAF